MANDAASKLCGIQANGAPSTIQSRTDFITLLRTLLRELRDKPETWENRTLPQFLEALAAWIEDLDGFYRNQGRSVPDQPSWEMLAEMLLAARVYE